MDRPGNIHGHQTPIIQNNNSNEMGITNGFFRGTRYMGKGANIISSGFNRLDQSQVNDKYEEDPRIPHNNNKRKVYEEVQYTNNKR